MAERAASGPQLWRLNVSGRLAIVDAPADPITSAKANDLISAVVAAQDAFDTYEIREALSSSRPEGRSTRPGWSTPSTRMRTET